ncbi:hypothetical protein D770_21295 [Flammeovirgaceae bacterium 311]|nr:hypothetical protein D770_21295 [Flammeovirgaceae bacterium 311]
MNIRVLILPVVLFLLLTLPHVASAQRNFSQKREYKNSLYLELGGMGPYYSLNLDHLISRRKNDRLFRHRKKVIYSYRLGFSVLPSLVSVPLGLSLITAPARNHHAELSVGIAPLLKNPFSIFDEGKSIDKLMLIGVGVGYRYQKPEPGLFLTIGIRPVMRVDPSSGDTWKIEKNMLHSGYLGIGLTL